MSSEPSVRAPVSLWRVVAIIVALAVIFWAGRMDFAAINFRDVPLRRLGELLASFVFLALLIERAVELILNWRFGAAEIEILTPLKQLAVRREAQMQLLSRDMELLINPNDRMSLVDDGMTDASQALLSQAAGTRERLDELTLHKREWAFWCAMLLAMALAFSGFQMLHGAFDYQVGLSELLPIQIQLFSFIDILLTAVVLAAGAEGIHRVISRLLEFQKESKINVLPE